MESALTDIQRDDDLSYVTKHFADMRGLRMAPFWAAFVILSSLEYAHLVSRRQGQELLVGMLALAGAWLAYAGRWYRRRYGLVMPREERVPSQVLSILETDRRPNGAARWWWFGVGTLVCALYLVDLFHPWFAEWFNGIGMVGVTIFLLPKACFTGGASWPVRGRQLLARGGIVVIVVLHVDYLLGYLDRWQDLGAAGMVLLLASLYDHWLLTRLLSWRSVEGRDA
jgi:hypothetical protein